MTVQMRSKSTVRQFIPYVKRCLTRVVEQMTNRRFFHSAVPDPQHFQLGICSEHEIRVIKDLLSPPNEKIVKGHLIDVVEHESNLMLKVRMLDAQIKMFPTPPGSFIVNATDNRAFGANVRQIEHVQGELIDGVQAFEPILSSDGLVLAPQKVHACLLSPSSICTSCPSDPHSIKD